jgi:hypothetical protein
MNVTPRKHRPFVPGDNVEVRPLDEILATLDERGTLEGVPFMPEMAAYCGKRFEVWKRADKTCEEGRGGAIRRLKGTVHLKELRCDGSAHGGCDAGCLFFWKEQWLRKFGEAHDGVAGSGDARCTVETLLRATRKPGTASEATAEDVDKAFSCQATQVREFTTTLKWWDLRQYARDIVSGNVSLREFLQGLWIGVFNKLQQLRKGAVYHNTVGTNKRTPQTNLHLEPGDLVQIKASAEIRATLDQKGRNSGLSFRPAMLPFCGKQYRVLRRVNRIIDAKTGKMLQLGGRCVILDGVVCLGAVRRFCPRMVYQYWRDIWLTRVSPAMEQCEVTLREAGLAGEEHEREKVALAGGVAAIKAAPGIETLLKPSAGVE